MNGTQSKNRLIKENADMVKKEIMDKRDLARLVDYYRMRVGKHINHIKILMLRKF
jgi:hypothetical protein